MKISDQKIALQEKINEYNDAIDHLIAGLSIVKIDDFTIQIYHKKENNINWLIANIRILKDQLQDVYDEYTYLNELYREESK